MKNLSYIGSFITGIVITLMVYFNTELSKVASNEVSIFVNHTVGITCILLIMFFFRKKKIAQVQKGKVPFYFYLSGLYGVAIISINTVTVTKVSASFMMAAAVFGQALISIILDKVGFLGLKERDITIPKAIGLSISFAGVCLMAFNGSSVLLLYAFLAVVAGMLTTWQMAFNSHFAYVKGPFFSALMNVVSGLCGVTVILLLKIPQGSFKAFTALPSVPLYGVVAGGMLGVIIVVASNIVLPKIPVVYSQLLMCSGQLISSVVFDKFTLGSVNPRMLFGALIVLIGSCISILFDKS